MEPIYFVAILDFEYDEENRKFYRDVVLKDQDGDIFYEKLRFKFLQMPLFTKTEVDLENRFDKWCYFLKNLETFDNIPGILNDPIFKKAFDKAALANMTIEQRDKYTVSLMNYLELKSSIDTAVEEREIEIAENLITLGSADELIAKATHLPIELIQEIRKRLGK